jgi:chemotaxis protein CheX
MITKQRSQVPADAHEKWGAIVELSAKEVFSLMLGAELTYSPEPIPTAGLNVTSMVGLAGSVCGLFTLRCANSSAMLMASKMLGLDVSSVDDTTLDAVGEACNMIAGNFKDKISGMGDGCQLSVPTVIVGEDYSLRALTNHNAIEVQLLFEGYPLVISIILNQ